ncbi:uncharacterized protein LOC125652124 isoform X9 [Ostrea edulis]|nr:uncharacterized protein LOC125652124 isoform X9 [Ostrea edulis]
MKDVFKTILDEYACYPDIDENVSVIICGKNTRFQHYYSNQYSDIKNCIGLSRRMGEFHIHPRIILISDGRPSDFTCTGDGEDSPLFEREEDKHHLLQLTRIIGRRHPIFCIPIGKDPDVVLLEFISAQSRGGKIVYPSEAKQFAKYSKNMRTASMLSFTLKNDNNDRDMVLMSLACTFPDEDFTEMDQADIFDMCSKKRLYNSWFEIMDEIMEEELIEDDHAYKLRDPRMPSLGTRVRRGPDWKWGNQDRYEPGTVVGYSKDCGLLNVEWDTGLKNRYRYGSTLPEKDKYDITVCDEPRILQDEFIAVGCLVKRGLDWMWGDQDGGEGTLGSVYIVKRNGIVWVCWSNGQTSHYRFGYQGKFDLQICDPFSSESREYLKDQKRNASLNRSQEFSYTPENESYSASSASPQDHDLKSGWKPCDSPLVSPQRLHVLKGCYFKNDRKYDEPSSDIESDGAKEFSSSSAVNQWMWKDGDGKWNPYPRKINDRINKCYRRNPNSTVVVTIKKHSFRVVMSKNIQIDLMTRETSDVKFVKNE